MIKKTKLILIFLIFFISCDKINRIRYIQKIDRDKDPIFVTKTGSFTNNLSEFNQTGRLYYLCKIWGHLKYYSNTDVNWNNILISKIGTVKKSKNKQEFIDVIDYMINLVNISDIKPEKSNIEEYFPVSFDWFNDTLYFNADITEKLIVISENRRYSKNNFVSQNWSGMLNFNQIEKYNKNYYPNENIRLLGLFEYWNVINYFYVYKNGMPKSWDSVLQESIQSFINTKSVIDYHLAVQELTGKLYDCHSVTKSDLLEQHFGRKVPNFRMKKIGNRFIVNKIRVKALDDGKIKIGDFITKINNKPVEEKYAELKKIIKGANMWSEQRMINPYVLVSTTDTNTLTILRKDKEITQKIIYKDYSEFVQGEISYAKSFKHDLIIKWLKDSIVYINLKFLFNSNYKKNIRELKKANRIIIDLRCYPNDDITLKLPNFFLSEKTIFFISTYADIYSPGLLRYYNGYRLGGGGDTYKGKAVVLVNEYTQSQAEFLTMALQASENVTVIGNQTAGSDGNITTFYFPGKISTTFSGIGIYYPDLTPTQRKGIKIDCEVPPTIKGIQKGRDEVLERALEYIKTGK